MPVTTLHPDYEANLDAWQRARDALRGEAAVKRAGERYLLRLTDQTDAEYDAYKGRATFYNATARTAAGFCGLVFRRPPFVKLPMGSHGLGQVLAGFANDADLLGTPLVNYAKDIVDEVIAVGRAGTLVDWEDQAEHRVYVARYAAEHILNWRTERIGGRNLLTLVVLYEPTGGRDENPADEFAPTATPQIRVLKLERTAAPNSQLNSALNSHPSTRNQFVAEVWRPVQKRKNTPGYSSASDGGPEWVLVDRRVPLRLGRPLPLIPFVFHGPRNGQPHIDKLPLADILDLNFDHYRLNADYKHGMHYMAMPTAWVSGFGKDATLRIGASTAWVSESPNASAGFLEFKGQGLETFERAMDQDERLMAILGSRLLESQKRVGESAEAIALRQSGEESILANLSKSVSASLTQVLRWAYWWNSTEDLPDHVTQDQVALELNTDYSTKGLSAKELEAIVASWQAQALSRDTMLDLLRRGEVLPEGRTNEEEVKLVDG
ncbi:MAG TPA: DUF4055 domain-containing protein, partial [Bacillota bacterium]|nr:DUF4055 domain-containing protein [Bacillota bacterium]